MQTTRVKNPRKQRKRLFNAPAHIRHKLMAAPTSAEILAQRGIRSLPVRKGDTVRVMRGDHKGFEGKVSRIDLKHFRVFIEGLTREKVDGSTVFVGLHPSKIMIKNLNLDDKLRKAILERKKPLMKKEAKPKKAAPKKPEKPAKLAVTKEEKPAKLSEEAKPTITVPEEIEEKAEGVAAGPKEEPKTKVAKAAPTRKPSAPRKKKEKPVVAMIEEKPVAKETKAKVARKTTAKQEKVEESKREKETPKPLKKPAARRKKISKTEGGA